MKWIKDLFNYRSLLSLSKRGMLEQVDQELRILRHDFQVALRYLKGNYRKRLNFYNRLPLYLVMGPSTFGKTTLLANSGLELRNVHNQALQQVMSTKYCVWWFSKEAVCLDTAGIYTESSAGELRNNLIWRGFLKLLKSYRASNPIAGLVVVLDLPVLVEDPVKRQKVLDGIKERIYEIAQYVNKLPIFVVFTKCDLIDGFSEFFADLKDDERAQPFGVTFADGDMVAPIQIFTEQFNDLLRRLNKKVIRRLQAEKDGDKKKQIKDFPLQLDALRSVIAEVVNSIPTSAHLMLFGIYFTSSTQRGVPCDYLNHAVQEKLGVALQKTSKELQAERSYFIEDLFKKIIFVPKIWCTPERKTHNFLWYTLAIIVIAAGLIGFSYKILNYSYRENFVVISGVNNILQNYKPERLERDNLGKLQSAVTRLERARQAWWTHFGFTETRQLRDFLKKTYYRAVAVTFVTQLQKTLETELTAANGEREQYNALKVYLMLGQPNKLDKQYVLDWFDHYWRKTFADSPEKYEELNDKLAAVLNYGVKINANDQIVNLTRSALNASNLSNSKVFYENLLNKYNGQDLVFSLADGQKISINKIYTRESFSQVVKAQIPAVVQDSGGKGADWVLSANTINAPASVGQTKVISELQSLYFTSYVNAWAGVFKEVKFSQGGDLKGARQLLVSLANGDIQLLALLKAAQAHLVITDAPAEFTQLVGAKFDWLKTVDVAAMQAALSNGVSYFSNILASDDNGRAAFDATVARFQGDNADALTALYALATKQPDVVRGWLQSIADSCWQSLLGTTRTYINAAWANTVLPQYKQTIENGYPVFQEEKRSISVSDFTKFFGPKGVMSNFFATYLRPFVDTQQMYWLWKGMNGQQLGISQDVLETFIRAALIQKMFYVNEDAIFGTRFSLLPKEMTPSAKVFVLDLEGQKTSYESGQKKVDHLVWPGPVPNSVTVEFFTAAGSNANTVQSDPWAWFRLLDKANLHVLEGTDHFSLTFDLNGNSIRYELVPEQQVNPFIQNIVSAFRCPEKL